MSTLSRQISLRLRYASFFPFILHRFRVSFFLFFFQSFASDSLDLLPAFSARATIVNCKTGKKRKKKRKIRGYIYARVSRGTRLTRIDIK